MNQWSCEDEKRFQVALLCYPENFPNRWEKIVEVFGFSKEMIYQRHQILQIELGRDSPLQYTNSSANNQPPKNNKGSSWTLKEHALFLLGEQKYGKGHWKNISKMAVVTRNATQVASHAQKFYIRQKEKKTIVHNRSSIHDFTLANYPPEYLNDLLSSHPHLMPCSCMIMQPSNTSIHSHIPLQHDDHSLPMTQLGTQIPSNLYQSHQVASPDLDLNHYSTSMNQIGPQNPSGVQLQNPYQQHNSEVVSQSLPRNHGNHPYQQHNSQVVSQSLPRNHGNHPYQQHNSQVVSQSLPRNHENQSESQYPYHTFLPLQNPPPNHQSLPQNYWR